MDASKNVSETVTTSGSCRFGLGHMDILVADLRTLADAIESGRILVRQIETREIAETEDFPSSTLTLNFIEHRPRPLV